MVINGVDKIDVNIISPGDTVKLKIKGTKIVESLYKHAQKIGCKLILTNYGEFYFKEYRSKEREKIINDLLK